MLHGAATLIYVFTRDAGPPIVPRFSSRLKKPGDGGWVMRLALHYRRLMDKARLRGALARLHQPLTTLQLARREGLDLDRAGYLLWELSLHDLVTCLNRSARQSRVYWLTDQGARVQRHARNLLRLRPIEPDFPRVNWDTYGWSCFRHRSAIIKALDRPLRPVQIKRRARQRDQEVRMSANNVRDAIKLLLARGIVQSVAVPREPNPSYELTGSGRAIRDLLLRAEVTPT